MKPAIDYVAIIKSCDLLFEDNRRATFKSWVFTENDACSASKLAEAGFYFAGNEIDVDLVCCIFCNKSLDFWDSTDNPWTEHQKHSSICEFGNKGKPEREYTIMELHELHATSIKKIFEHQFDLVKEVIDSYFKELKLIVSK